MEVTPYATLSAGELETQTAPLNWIVENLFLEAGAGILGGAPKSCKSFFALDLCVAIASGTPCAGRFRTLCQGPVVLLCAEDPTAVVSSRLTALAAARGRALKDLPLRVIVEPSVRLPDGIERLAATLAESQPRLLLLDPLIRLHRADENSASEMSVILDGLRGLARQSKTAILLVHHARKASSVNAGAGLRGSSDMAAFGDSNLYLRRVSQDGLLELKIEHRAAAPPQPLQLQLIVDQTGTQQTARFVVNEGEKNADDPTATRILELLTASEQPLSSAVLREKLGVRNQTVAQALQYLVADGLILRAGRDGWRSIQNQV
jgi:biotin operon repressor